MIKLLFIAGQGAESVQLDVDLERRQISDGLSMAVHRDQLTFVELPAATFRSLALQLGESPFDILHFSGHGEDDGSFCLLDKDEYSVPVSAYSLTELFSSIERSYKVIVLSFCNSHVLAQSLTDFSMAVIFTTGKIDEQAAACFASDFYRYLASGQTLTRAFNIARTTVRDLYPDEADLLQMKTADGVDADQVILTSTFKNQANLELIWQPYSFGDISFGLRNVGDRLAKHPALRFYESTNFDFDKVRKVSEYGQTAFRVCHERFNNSVLVEENIPQILHPSAAIFMGIYKLDWKFGVPFPDFMFNFETLWDAGFNRQQENVNQRNFEKRRKHQFS